MITLSHVRSFYNGLLVTCYDCNGVKYVANQHGNWDVYEGEYMRGGRARTVSKDAEEIRNVIAEYRRQGK
ncbi:MAG: hypothetical protein K8I29_13870 [Alphaproteobacteria bacterium]|uniref:Uncharacterized protein n=1 Tax=Candidatus Nitrobium versatile TaxID=2884831 RepID=A0A953JEM4_9BACT|nr:hypothetical protein [Candidatus Nitrobium versatile]